MSAHAQAHSVRLGLLYEDGAVSLLVQDDGQGFDPKSGWHPERYGLRAMSDRARNLGATIEVDSVPGWGTRIRARFPYQRDPQQPGPRLRVLVAAGRPVLRAGLARLLTWTEPGIEVVGEVGTAADAAQACASLRPDVALVDLGLTGRCHAQGRDAARVLLRGSPQLAVVGICEPGDDEQVAGACGRGRAAASRLARTARNWLVPWWPRAAGQAILSGPVLRQLHRGLRAEDGEAALTEREREVRVLMEQGLPDKIIAERLVLSVKTVEKHAGAVLRKTGARNRTELRRWPAAPGPGNPGRGVGEVLHRIWGFPPIRFQRPRA